MIKRIALVFFLGVTLVWAGQRQYWDVKNFFVAATDTARVISETIPIFALDHGINKIDGRFILDSTKYGETGWGNADTVDIVAKLKNKFGAYTTIDSTRKVIALSGQATCTLNIAEFRDTLLIGERIDVILRIADTLNAGISNDSTADLNYKYHIFHNYTD